MLAPVVVGFSLIIRQRGLADQHAGGTKPPMLPSFVVGFLMLAALNSIGLIPATVSEWTGSLSRWALLIAIAAVGVKTSLKRMLQVGPGAIFLLVIETLFLGTFIVTGLQILG